MKKILLSLAAALCMCASAAAQTVAPFKDGDRAVFLGNSITDWRLTTTPTSGSIT